MDHPLKALLLALCLAAITLPAQARDSASQKIPANLAPCEGSFYPFPQECGKVEAIQERSEIGQSNGVGAVAGGVGGHIVGRKKTRHTLSRVALTGAGAAAGDYAQRQMSSSKHWLLRVRFSDGRTMDIKSRSNPTVSLGDTVRIHDGKITWSAPGPIAR